jgi:hypothetical protein
VVSELIQLLGSKTPVLPPALRIVDPDAQTEQPVSKVQERKAA